MAADVIQLTDEALKAWVQRVLGPIGMCLLSPSATCPRPGVGLYLMELVDNPPTRQNGPSPLQFGLRYLVTAWADDPEEEHRLLGELAFAALDDADLQVEFAPLPAATWAAFGIVPRPAFLLRVPIRRERPSPPPKLVRAPLVIQSTPMVSLFGKVLAPGDVPLFGVTVELPALELTEHTDAKGLFHFSPIPEEPRSKLLHLRRNGRELQVTVDQPTSEAEPVVIQFDPTAQ
jgi:Pvc16 N-terminal domain